MKPESYQSAYERARRALARREPHDIVARSEARFQALDDGRGRFELLYLGKTHIVAYPDGAVTSQGGDGEVTIFDKIILLHYLLAADGSPLTGQWINFRQLPGGLMYLSAFEAQCLQPIAREFGYDLPRFLQAGEAAGGESTRIGDGSFLFRVLPRFLAICVLWFGDEEMPPAVDFLFDESAPHYLPTEDIDAVCRELGQRLLAKTR